MEPFPGLKVDLSARQSTAGNTSIQYYSSQTELSYNDMPKTFTGRYDISQIAIGTMFKKMGSAETNYASEVFSNFLANRKIFARRLENRLINTNYPENGFLSGLPEFNGQPFDPQKGSYTENSSDVLIPAFLAAYTGKDADRVSTNPFLPLLSILPNWNVNFDGLSRIPWVKNNFKSVSLTHKYTCNYTIANYTSYSTWIGVDDGNKEKVGYIRSVDGIPVPSSPYDIATVSLNEQFVPLLGIKVELKNSMSARAEYRKIRNISLNLSSTQLVEMASEEYVIGMGYLVKDFDMILRLKNNTQTKVKNDLKLSADLTLKDVKTLLRKIDENITQASNGQKVFSLKIAADYVFSSKVNIQLFFDRQSTMPLISTSFPVSSSNFGVSFKFTLSR
jgi:cell surface protein SprA